MKKHECCDDDLGDPARVNGDVLRSAPGLFEQRVAALGESWKDADKLAPGANFALEVMDLDGTMIPTLAPS